MNKQLASIVAALGLAVLGPTLWLSSQQGNPVSASEVSREGFQGTELGDSQDFGPRTLLAGRVVDADDKPLASIEVALYAEAPWSRHAHVPRLDPWVEVPRYYASDSLVGWHQVTDDRGAFEFDVPTPSCSTTHLRVHPDIYHAVRNYTFQKTTASMLQGDELLEGTRDLGKIVLANAGAITGVVHDEQGNALEGLNAYATKEITTLGLDWSNANGEFTVGHLPAVDAALIIIEFTGMYEIYGSGPFPVTAGATYDTGKTVLHRNPTLPGHVESPSGERLAGVHVVGEPRRGLGDTSTVSNADGTFDLPVEANEDYALYATHRTGALEPRSELGSRVPGTKYVVLVLEHDPQTTFLVRAADTKEPISEFRLTIKRNAESDPADDHLLAINSPVSEHPDGSCTTGARPGIDKVQLYAPGYQEVYSSVAHAGGKRIQIVELQPAPHLTGRVVSNHVAVAGVDVLLKYRNPGQRFSQRDTLHADPITRQIVKTDADGRFTFLSIPSMAPNRLIVDGRDSGVIRKLVRVGNVNRDLGDVELEPWARIEGLVIVPFGTDPKGIAVHSEQAAAGSPVLTDRFGHFAFERIPPGNAFLNLSGYSRSRIGDQRTRLHAQSGLTTRSTLKLPASTPTQVRVRVHGAAGTPSGRWSVRFERPPSLAPVAFWARQVRLGELSHDGSVSGEVQPIGPARVVLTSGNGISVVPDHDWVELAPGASIDLEVTLKLGVLELAFPRSIQWPDMGDAAIAIGDDSIVVSVVAGKLVPRAPLSLNAAGHLLIPNLPTGRVTVRCRVRKSDMASLARALSSGGTGSARPVLYENGVDVQIGAGVTTLAKLP